MATAKTPPAQARATGAQPGLGFQCNDIVEGTPELIEQLAQAGFVDPHPDALAHARSQASPVVKIADVAAALEVARAAAQTPAEPLADEGEPA